MGIFAILASFQLPTLFFSSGSSSACEGCPDMEQAHAEDSSAVQNAVPKCCESGNCFTNCPSCPNPVVLHKFKFAALTMESRTILPNYPMALSEFPIEMLRPPAA